MVHFEIHSLLFIVGFCAIVAVVIVVFISFKVIGVFTNVKAACAGDAIRRRLMIIRSIASAFLEFICIDIHMFFAPSVIEYLDR